MTQQNVSELAKQGNAVVQKYIRLYFFLVRIDTIILGI